MDWTPLVQAIPSGGGIIALLIIVIVFLKHIEADAKLRTETHLLCEKKLEGITERSEGVIKDNTSALMELRDAVRDLRINRVA